MLRGPLLQGKCTNAEGRRLNTRGPFLGCKFACSQFLKQSPHPNGHRGWIVNVASVAGLVGAAGAGSCCPHPFAQHAAYTMNTTYLLT